MVSPIITDHTAPVNCIILANAGEFFLCSVAYEGDERKDLVLLIGLRLIYVSHQFPRAGLALLSFSSTVKLHSSAGAVGDSLALRSPFPRLVSTKKGAAGN